MKKCIILLPTKYNDGSSVPANVLTGIRKRIDQKFDGHTIDGHVEGTYRMEDGSMASDRLIKVWVAVNPDKVDDLKKLARKFAGILKQESLYFEVTEAEVEFLRP